MPRPLKYANGNVTFSSAEKRDDYILRMLDLGWTSRALADYLGVTHHTCKVYAWRAARRDGRNRQIALRGFPDKASRDMWIYRKAQEGVDTRDIAEALEVTFELVWRVIKYIRNCQHQEADRGML